jgi:GNAT superfamily N-acetyltransferase
MKFHTRQVDTRNPTIRNVLLHLQKKCLPADKPHNVMHGHWWIVYTCSGIPVAFAGMSRSSNWLDAGYLCRAGVVPEYTGNGLQKKLIRARIAKAKKLRWSWLITDTTANPASGNNLMSQGFRLYEPAVPWAYKHSLYWRLNISR